MSDDEDDDCALCGGPCALADEHDDPTVTAADVKRLEQIGMRAPAGNCQTRLESRAVREQLALLREARRAILAELGQSAGFRLFHLQQVLAAVDKVSGEAPRWLES